MYVDPHASLSSVPEEMNEEVEAQRPIDLRHPSENLSYGAQNESSKKMALVTSKLSYPDKLCMRASHNNRTWPVVHHLPYRSCGESQRPAHLVRLALDLNDVSALRRALVGNVYVCAYARLGAVVPCSDGDAADPVDEGC